ncbi:MAG: hypothetical protein ABSB19_16455 [Methylomonas sp.]
MSVISGVSSYQALSLQHITLAKSAPSSAATPPAVQTTSHAAAKNSGNPHGSGRVGGLIDTHA